MHSGYVTYIYPPLHVPVIMCCGCLWPGRCNQHERWSGMWAQRWHGVSANKVGSITASHVHS